MWTCGLTFIERHATLYFAMRKKNCKSAARGLLTIQMKIFVNFGFFFQKKIEFAVSHVISIKQENWLIQLFIYCL